jgi:histidyl-tRNA synthetase
MCSIKEKTTSKLINLNSLLLINLDKGVDMQDKIEKKIVEPRTLPGFMELSPGDQILFNNIKDNIRKVFELYGFLPLDTPSIESAEVLLAKGGGETEKQVYRIDRGESKLCLIYDLTVPLAKYVAARSEELTFPFKRYQMSKVYRGERAQKGRFREFYQCDADIINRDNLSIINDAEVISVAYRIFNQLKIGDFTILINNRKLFSGLFQKLELEDERVEVLRIIDKIDKIGREKVREMLIDIKIPELKISRILNFISINGSNDEQIRKLEDLKITNPVFIKGLEELKELFNCLEIFGVPETNFRLNVSIARGLDYYTGTIFETYLNDNKNIGSICSGGRYDNLAEYYTDKKLPGVGMSIGLTRLFSELKERKLISTSKASISQVMVLPMTTEISSSLKILSALRENGIESEMNFENMKFKNKLNYANKLGIPFVVFIGEEELSSGLLTLKDMTSGEQQKLTLQQIISKLSN